MTLDQAKQLRKTTAALVRAEGQLVNATDVTVVAAAGEYVNAKRTYDQALAAPIASTPPPATVTPIK